MLLDESGNAFLTDFGIAKLLSETTALTHSGAIIGTPSYMAPEQWIGGTIDARTDTYAFGVMLFEMLTGRAPFQGDTPYRVMHMHTDETPPLAVPLRQNLPPAIDHVLHKALAKDSNARYQSAFELVKDFKAAWMGGAISAPPLRRSAPTASVTPVTASLDAQQPYDYVSLSAVPAPKPRLRRIRPRIVELAGILTLLVFVIVGIGLGLLPGGQSKSTLTPTNAPTIPPSILATQLLVAILPTNTPVAPTVTLYSTYTAYPTHTSFLVTLTNTVEAILPTATTVAYPAANPTNTSVPTLTSIPLIAPRVPATVIRIFTPVPPTATPTPVSPTVTNTPTYTAIPPTFTSIPPRIIKFTVSSTLAHNFTNIQIRGGQIVTIDYVSGKWRAGPLPTWPYYGPDGDPQTSNKKTFPIPNARIMALVVGIGSQSLYAVGNHLSFMSTISGELWLAANDDDYSDDAGSIIVTITISSD